LSTLKSKTYTAVKHINRHYINCNLGCRLRTVVLYVQVKAVNILLRRIFPASLIRARVQCTVYLFEANSAKIFVFKLYPRVPKLPASLQDHLD